MHVLTGLIVHVLCCITAPVCFALQRSPDGFLLGDWCTLMRSEYAQGRLEPDVADALAQEVPGWSWSLTDTAFETNLDALKAVRAYVAACVRANAAGCVQM